MAKSQNSRDLIKGALALVGEVTDGTSRYHGLAEEFLNDVYLAILSGSNEFEEDVGEPWAWARNSTPRTFSLQPAYETGTVSLTNNLTTGTFSSAPSSGLGSFEKRWLKVNDRGTYYQIVSHTAGATAFTLDKAYIEATGSALSFKAIPLVYNLGANILRLVEPFRVYVQNKAFYSDPQENGKIYGIGLNELRKNYPIQLMQVGVPQKFATHRRNEDEWWVEFDTFVDTETKVDFDCVEIPAGLIDSEDSVPMVPREFRNILKFGTAHFLAIQKEEAEKAQYLFNLTKAKIRAMKKAETKTTTVSGKDKGKLQPRQEQIKGNRLLGYN